MSDGELIDSQLPANLRDKVPKTARPVAEALLQVNSKDRAQLLRASQKSGAELPSAMTTSVQMTSWQGPLPPSAELERYNQIVAGGAERLIAMAEKQAEHRMQLENHVAREQMKQSGRGQIFALVIGLAGILSAAVVGSLGHTAVAIALATGSLGTLAVTFIVGKSRERASRQAKA